MRHFRYPRVAQWDVAAHHTRYRGAMALYIHVGGRQGYSLQEVTAHSGSVQLGQGAVVPVEALEMAYGEDLVE